MPGKSDADQNKKVATEPRPKDEQPKPEKSGEQGRGPEWTGEGDSSIERGQRASERSTGGGSQWENEK
jgi:hypothetical protein